MKTVPYKNLFNVFKILLETLTLKSSYIWYYTDTYMYLENIVLKIVFCQRYMTTSYNNYYFQIALNIKIWFSANRTTNLQGRHYEFHLQLSNKMLALFRHTMLTLYISFICCAKINVLKIKWQTDRKLKHTKISL